jgi:hypothetical protein
VKLGGRDTRPQQEVKVISPEIPMILEDNGRRDLL